MTWHAVALVVISVLILWGAGLRFDCGIAPSPYVRPYSALQPRAPLQPRPSSTNATQASHATSQDTSQDIKRLGGPVPKVPEPMLVESSVAMPFTDQPQF